MKVKELSTRLQSLNQELDVYIWNEKEHSLFVVEDVHETSDFGENEKGENEWEDFVAIFPKFIPEYSKIEKLEYRNLSQNTANCDKFTLTPEEVRMVKKALIQARWYISEFIAEFGQETDPEIIQQNMLISNDYNNLLNRIKQYQDESKN